MLLKLGLLLCSSEKMKTLNIETSTFQNMFCYEYYAVDKD
jgi:hypothetical protein